MSHILKYCKRNVNNFTIYSRITDHIHYYTAPRNTLEHHYFSKHVDQITFFHNIYKSMHNIEYFSYFYINN